MEKTNLERPDMKIEKQTIDRPNNAPVYSKKQILLNDIQDKFELTTQEPSLENYSQLQYLIIEAQQQWISTSNFDSKLAELYKKALRNEVENWFNFAKEMWKMYDYDNLVELIREAKKREVELTDIEAKLPELKKEIIRCELEDAFVTAWNSQSHYNTFETYLKKARNLWIDVIDKEKKAPELKKQAALKELQYARWDFSHNATLKNFNKLENAFSKVNELGIEMNPILKTAIMIKSKAQLQFTQAINKVRKFLN